MEENNYNINHDVAKAKLRGSEEEAAIRTVGIRRPWPS